MASTEIILAKRIKKENEDSEETEEVELEEFEVEKIVDQRVLDGQVQYLLKWKGYSDADNTWEPEEHLNCPELLEDFLNSQKTVLCKSESDDSPSDDESGPGDCPFCFSRRSEPEQIIIATKNDEILMLLMKY
ncbi:chromobox protein homolog 3-like [Perognathus longimembris pacificus]|uniref:chromobox protein homolog 3-like n=1 Tax=Perognathus longimembris pacificus TaxID=214514 RepID=UPI002018E393|nr:chromobox protein homolog 3-like [Perognathus longimembris pacificus]XP_048191370.1 chromobox protein homolog 3-like [Perognathus longimembris pacificus]XP_048191375.1 chromobox protein homolog 3-like [Perognathus longimembris pacificus]XP_048191376.1 chromobox protein homolog 3-like [Perognathus longimembris pacificus]